MDIRHRKQLKALAARQVSGCPEEKKLILLFSGICLGLALLVTAINYLLGLQIDKTGGLSNMGTRAVLDTLGQVLPMIQSVIVLCLELGYLAAVLRIARGQFVSTRTLKLGFDRFWPLLRLTVLRGLIFLGAGLLSMYLGIMIFLATPLSNATTELLTPLLSNASPLDPSLILDDALYGQLVQAMAPCFILCGVVYALIGLPLWYRYRLASFVLIDKPGSGAVFALRESRLLMGRNRLAFFRLDLSLWYYYVPLFLVGFVAYGDLLLSLAGITLPISEAVAFFGFYLLFLAGQFLLYYFLRNRVEATYALAYESLLPKEPPEPGVVLGNIFQM